MLPESSELGVSRWNAEQLAQNTAWRYPAPAGLLEDARALANWAKTVADPIAELGRGTLHLPTVESLACKLNKELDFGAGVALVHGVPEMDESTLRLLYLAIGLQIGDTIDTYGRLYDVADHGVSYRDKPIPVSQTRESTGMHTDSSARSVCPRVIGLLCVRPALAGGMSRVVSAAEVHEQLRVAAPQALKLLYGSFMRDVVTPGGNREVDSIRENCFPVFSCEDRFKLRYMRYWIETGHKLAQSALSSDERASFDALDERLADPANFYTFRLAARDMVFLDNTTVAHDRDDYEDDPAAPRLLVRLWLDRANPSGTP